MTDQELNHPTTLYARIAETLERSVAALPEGTLAQRFHHAMLANLRYVVAHDIELRQMVIAGLEGSSDAIQTGTAHYPRMTVAFHTLASGATDSLSAAQIGQMAVLLTNFHLLFMLFLLHDRTENYHATFRLLDFARDAFTLIRPLLMIPPGAKALARLSDILASALGGGHAHNP